MSRLSQSIVLVAALALAVVLAVSCDKGPPEPVKDNAPATNQPVQPQPANMPKGPMPVTNPQPAAGPGPKLGWTKPEAWKKVANPNRMRLETYMITKLEGDPEDAEMSVSVVGGSTDANIKRWEGQFDGAPKATTEKKEVAGLQVTIVTIAGDMKGGGGPMMGGGGDTKKDFALLGAIVHIEPRAYFFKMWGPKKTVESARGDFDQLVNSFAKQ